MRHLIRIEDTLVPAALAGVQAARVLLMNGEASLAVSLRTLDGGAVLVTVGGETRAVHIAGDEAGYFIHCDGEVFELAVLDPLAVYGQAAGRVGGLEGRAPMPGNVVAVRVALGDRVRTGDMLLVLESMKLEVALRAECDAVVADITCSVGQSFEKGALLVRLASVEAAT